VKALALLALGLVACGGHGVTSLVDDTPEVSAPEPVEPMPRRSLQLDPDALSEGWAAEAVEAWSEAADVHVEPDGIPVRALPDPEMWTPCIVDGKPMSCLPNAKWDGEVISVRRDGPCPARSLAHEVGHALGLPHLPAPSLMQSPAPRGCDAWSVGADVMSALGVLRAE
jgi:hypothetical protein